MLPMKAVQPNVSKREKIIPLSIKEKNAVMERILDIIFSKRNFLLLGHEYADEDCIASLVALGLLLRKFSKKVCIFLEKPIPPQLNFFVGICNYNKIRIFTEKLKKIKIPDAIFILDTPKPEMISAGGYGKKLLAMPDIPKIELDHHFTADADYSGDPDYRLTMRASSTCEIIAQMCVKLEARPTVLKRYGIENLYSRNIVLAMLTGMIGDAKFGNYLSERRDKAFYDYFLKKFNKMLSDKFYKNSGNISSVEEILKVLETLSAEESKIYKKIMELSYIFKNVGVIVLNKEKSNDINTFIEYTQFVGVVKMATDAVADKAHGLGLSVYFDPPEISDKIQFRLRASEEVKGIDLRPILTELKIMDGGGHPGAIGFRFSVSEIPDLDAYIKVLTEKAQLLLSNSHINNEQSKK
ncbi:phosphoesterase [Treponema pedis]|nr:phosphoesterase [Treponema pedis]